ncbi:MAG: GSU2086 family protein [Armatimonadota bacterium]
MNTMDRRQLIMYPLSARKHQLDMRKIAVSPDASMPDLSERHKAQIEVTAANIVAARDAGKPVMFTFGAHLVKNGLAPVIIRLIEEGWITHAATNGAGSIHDWEFGYIGVSTEDVRENTANGCFGTWEETGRFINLAIAAGGIEGLGYGASVAKMIAENGIVIPPQDQLRAMLAACSSDALPGELIGAYADLLYLTTGFDIPSGFMPIQHQYHEFSIQSAAYRAGIPFTVHPGIGYDIIYTHPMSCGGAIGRGAVTDFLTYAESVSRLSGGVHVTIGSAVMAPMIFEKAMSMANNLLLQHGSCIEGHKLVIVDIQDGGDWDWNTGEPPKDHPAYYLRFCKSFYRMGGSLEYICLDNKLFLLGLNNRLKEMR